MALIEGTQGGRPVTRVIQPSGQDPASAFAPSAQGGSPSTSAANARTAAVQQAFAERQEALSVLDRYFSVFDTAAEGGDGDQTVSEEDLAAVRDGDYDQPLQDAAEYLLSNEVVLTRLDVADDQGGLGLPDHEIHRRDLDAVLAQQPLFADAGTFISDTMVVPRDSRGTVGFDENASPEEAAGAVVGRFNPGLFESYVREHVDDTAWLQGFFRALGARDTAYQVHAVTQLGSEEGVEIVRDALANMYADGVLTGQDLARMVEHWTMLDGDFPSSVGDLFAGLDGAAGGALQAEIFRATSQLSQAGQDDAPTGPFTFSADAVERLSEGDRESLSTTGARAFIPESTQEDVERYLEFTEELNWLVANLGPAMEPGELEAAIGEFMDEKGEEWRQEFESLQQAVIEDGIELLERLGADDLELLSDAERSALLDAMGNDPGAALAINLAVTAGADQLDADTLDRALGFFPSVGLTEKGSSLLTAVGSAYIREVALDRVMGVDPNDPQSIVEARAGLDELRNSNLARVLGVSDHQFNEVVDALEATLPEPGMSSSEVYRRLEALDAAIQDLETGSSAHATQIGSALRLVGIGASSISLYGDFDRLAEDPNLENTLRATASAAGLGDDVTELLVQSGRVSRASTVGRLATNPSLGKFLGAVGIAFGALDLARSVGDGDYSQAGIAAVGLGGAALATFGTTSWAGPVGIAIGLLAAGGSIGLNQYRRVQESNRHMNDTSASFLEHAGFEPDVAEALVDQSGEGYSPVPILMAYGEARGLTASETVDWLNGLSGDELSALRDTLHRTLDAIDGDLSEFPATAESDAAYQEMVAENPWWAPPPSSVAQVDAYLEQAGVTLPA